MGTMKFDPHKHHRRSIRLRGYDYARAGAYFVTIVAQGRQCLFGEVVEGEMRLNDAGQMVRLQWAELPRRFLNINTDEFIVMPNHVHGILIIVGASLVDAQGARAGTRPAPTIGDAIGAFKSITTNEYIRGVKEHGWTPFHGRLWQRNY